MPMLIATVRLVVSHIKPCNGPHQTFSRQLIRSDIFKTLNLFDFSGRHHCVLSGKLQLSDRLSPDGAPVLISRVHLWTCFIITITVAIKMMMTVTFIKMTIIHQFRFIFGLVLMFNRTFPNQLWFHRVVLTSFDRFLPAGQLKFYMLDSFIFWAVLPAGHLKSWANSGMLLRATFTLHGAGEWPAEDWSNLSFESSCYMMMCCIIEQLRWPSAIFNRDKTITIWWGGWQGLFFTHHRWSEHLVVGRVFFVPAKCSISMTIFSLLEILQSKRRYKLQMI